ncbi:MAG: polyphosphate kinase 1 [Muribaculaceae bacterium]|nr:polyphosphate kinase 1 [Muribaculaceae bacterium]
MSDTPALVNRDKSWISFNLRVSDEAARKRNTLGERVMFHGISHSNLAEFLQVRYPAAIEEFPENVLDDIVEDVSKHYKTLMDRFRKFNKEFRIIRRVKDLSKDDLKWSEKYFKQNVFPALLPITVDKTRQANIREGMYLLVVTERDDVESIGYIEIPNNLGRFIPIPGKHGVIAIEDLVKANVKSVVRGRKIVNVVPFSILRSAEIFIQPGRYIDPYELIKETLHEREKSWVTQLEIASSDKGCIKAIRKMINMDPNTIIFATELIRLSDLKKIPSSIYKENDKPRKFEPYDTFPTEDIFDYIKRNDRLCFHPYESYDGSMVRFLEAAAVDPDVTSIRISLYRVANRSRIIDALLRAADNGKLVTVLVELKARFDEKHNMQLSSILREGGIRIIYTKPEIKTHAKVCLVTRKEKKGLRIYSHVGTGNYSETNSKLYTDYSYFTADQEVGADLTQFFNLLTSDQGDFKSRKIIYAPYNLKSTIIDEINRQIKRAKNDKSAQIIIKCNGLTDEGVARRLVEAAKAGVKVILIIRSSCIIQPQKNIKIYSVVGRFLEHSRICVFGANKDCRVYIGSSDMMTRNLSRRNELMLLVEANGPKQRLLSHIETYLNDNVDRREIGPKCTYEDPNPKKGKKVICAQEAFIKEAKKMANTM